MTYLIKNPFRQLFILFLFFIFISKAAYVFSLVSLQLAILGTAVMLVILGICFLQYESIIAVSNKMAAKLSKTRYSNLLLVLFLANLFSKTCAVQLLRIDSVSAHPDIYCYAVTANEILNTGIVNTYANYCLRFSHMYWFAVFLVPAIKLFGFSAVGFSIYLSIINSISTVLFFDICAHIYNRERVFIAFLLYSFLPSQILLPQYITHEEACVFFVSLLLWVIYRFHVTSFSFAFFKGTIASLLLLFAIKVNSSGIVVLIALLIVVLIVSIQRKSAKYLVFCLIVVPVILLGNILMQNYQIHHSSITANSNPIDKIVWTLFVGSNIDTSGAWSKEDATLFSEIEKDEFVGKTKKEYLIERYRFLLQNPKSLFKLGTEKFSTMWSVFTYPIMFSSETIPNKQMQLLYNTKIRNPAVLYEFFISVLVVAFGLVSKIKSYSRCYTHNFVVVQELSLMGQTALLLLTECNNKYTIIMQPFFWITCFVMSDEARSECINEE